MVDDTYRQSQTITHTPIHAHILDSSPHTWGLWELYQYTMDRIVNNSILLPTPKINGNIVASGPNQRTPRQGWTMLVSIWNTNGCWWVIDKQRDSGKIKPTGHGERHCLRIWHTVINLCRSVIKWKSAPSAKWLNNANIIMNLKHTIRCQTGTDTACWPVDGCPDY